MTIVRRRFVRVALGGAAGVALGRVGWRTGGCLPRLDTQVIPLHDLPRGFDGFRILLLSDVHAGANMEAPQMAAVVRFVNSLGADLVVIAGDMIDGKASVADMRGFAREFRDLRATHGVLAVLGNHDRYAGIETVSRELRSSGLTLLRGESHTLERAGDRIVVLGVDDPVARAFDPPQHEAVATALARAPEGLLPILVAHRPGAFDAAGRLGIPLTLSGHTHGGQICVPFTRLTPVRLVTKYLRGHYQRDGSHLIVSSGIGTGGFPIRIGAPSSVTLVTLRRA